MTLRANPSDSFTLSLTHCAKGARPQGGIKLRKRLEKNEIRHAEVAIEPWE